MEVSVLAAEDLLFFFGGTTMFAFMRKLSQAEWVMPKSTDCPLKHDTTSITLPIV